MMAKAKRKSRPTWLTIDLPSNGVNYEQCGDREAEQHVDYVTGHDDYKYDRTHMRFEHEPSRVVASPTGGNPNHLVGLHGVGHHPRQDA